MTGRSDSKVDAKGRLSIPAAFRDVLGSGKNDEIVIMQSPTQNLLLFGSGNWDAKIKKDVMSKGNVIGQKKMWRVMYRLSENSHTSTIDNQWRITIPNWLLEKAGISKEVVVLAAYDRIVVWAPQIYEKWKMQEDVDSTIEDLGFV